MSAPTPARFRRSYLFVPASRPDRFDRALDAGAHAVIVDLEDAVPPADKDRAREAIAAWLSPAHPVLVRVNARDTAWFDADVRACARSGLAGFVLPKVASPDDVRALASLAGDGVPILPLVESAVGLWNAQAIAATPGVERLVFGSIDFQLDLGVEDDELLAYRAQLVLASRVAGIEAPVDGVTTALDDAERIRHDAARSRALGFGGKLCIHPKQVVAINAAFAPREDEVAWARRVVAADAAAGGAAVAVDGKMVDRPVLLRARAILAEAERRTGR